jgi:hypothetical protein
MTSWLRFFVSVPFAESLISIVWGLGLIAFGELFSAWLLRLPLTLVRIGGGPLLASFRIGITRYEVRANPLVFTMSKLSRELVGAHSFGRILAWRLLAPAFPLLIGVAFVYSWCLALHLHRFAPGAEIHYLKADGVFPLKPWDVILRVDDVPVEDALDLVRRLERWESGSLRLKVEREQQILDITLQRANVEGRTTGVCCRNRRSGGPLGPFDTLVAIPQVFADLGRYGVGRWTSERIESDEDLNANLAAHFEHGEPIQRVRIVYNGIFESTKPMTLYLWSAAQICFCFGGVSLFLGTGHEILSLFWAWISGRALPTGLLQIASFCFFLAGVAWYAWAVHSGYVPARLNYPHLKILNMGWIVQI